MAGMLVVLFTLFVIREGGLRWIASDSLRVEVSAIRHPTDPWGQPWLYVPGPDGLDAWTRYSSGPDKQDQKLAGDDVAVRTPATWLAILLTEDALLLLGGFLVPCLVWARLAHLARPRSGLGGEVLSALAMGIPAGGVAGATAAYLVQRLPGFVGWNPLALPAEVTVGLPVAAIFVGATLVVRLRFPPPSGPSQR
jgi:hypothetical protein